MKKLSLVIAALAMVLGITQCKKQEDPVGGKLITQKVTFTTSFGNGSKLGVDEEGGRLDLSWQVGDKITVSDGQTEPSSTLECISVSEGGKTGTFEGTITCIENAELTFTVGTKPDYMNQHFTAINESEIYLVGESDFEQSGNYEVDMALPYAILKVDLAELATAEDAIVSVKIGDAVEPIAKVTGVKTGACQVYLLLPLAATGQTTLKFTNTTSNKTITHTYSLAPNGFYTGGGNGGFAPIMPDYLCFTAVEAGSKVQMLIYGSLSDLVETLEASTDGGKTWEPLTFTYGTATITLTNVGDKVYFRRKEKACSFSDSFNYAQFAMTGKIAASGNIMSLIDPTCEETEIPCEDCFVELFHSCSSLTAAPALPATSLKKNCYGSMFMECTSLTTAPELPAMNLAENCYNFMFYYCTSLTAAPELPATNLATSCYRNMFKGCSSLNSITVHFTTWSSSTSFWVTNVPAGGTFHCPSNLPEKYGPGNIPTGWTVEKF